MDTLYLQKHIIGNEGSVVSQSVDTVLGILNVKRKQNESLKQITPEALSVQSLKPRNMKRNKQTEKQKQLRRLAERYHGLPYWRNDGAYDWIPVEEPQFIGYEVHLTLNAVRRDESLINEILDVFNARRPIFFKDLEYLSYIRKYKTYNKVHDAWSERKRRFGWNSWTPEVFNRLSGNIGEHKYNTLSEQAKSFFGEEVKYSWSGTPYNEYHLLRWPNRFPFYAISYKLVKAYSTHRGIPRGEEWSEHDYLQKKLEDERYWSSSKYGNRGYRWDSKSEKSQLRRLNAKSWRTILKKADNEESQEYLEAKLLKRTTT